jgi:RNA polymerase sigma-70 factor (ECF subfamily)
MTPPTGGWSTDAPDDDLVAAAQRGDRRALELLLRRHDERILVLCRRLCRDRGDAEDAAQNALIAIVRGLPRFDRSAAFTTWSYRVATNACLDELRRRGRRPVPADPEHADLTPAYEGDRVPHVGSADPADEAVTEERRSTIQHALDQLPDEFRLPVVLRDLADLDYAEIGETLGLPPGTVRSRIARGRAKLAVLLHELDPNGNPAPPRSVSTDELT